MASETSQLKFAKSERTGELIGFVSRHPKNQKLIGVREDSRFGKQICVLSEHLKSQVEPDVLYEVELKPMHKANGYVVVSATPVLYEVQVETIIVPKSIYQVTVTFENSTKLSISTRKMGKVSKAEPVRGFFLFCVNEKTLKTRKESFRIISGRLKPWYAVWKWMVTFTPENRYPSYNESSARGYSN